MHKYYLNLVALCIHSPEVLMHYFQHPNEPFIKVLSSHKMWYWHKNSTKMTIKFLYGKG